MSRAGTRKGTGRRAGTTGAARKGGLLRGARVYLSGPMDFVASRAEEQRHGWRNRVGDVLRALGVTVFDPWSKPGVRGLHEYGRETPETVAAREGWTFEPSAEGATARARITGKFWEALHIDLRMVDTSDFTVCFCPTNVYSVGTPHEIVVCRQQRKPVLCVSPQVRFPAMDALRAHLKDDPEGSQILDRLAQEVPILENPAGAPSLWYMPLIGPEGFFDGFGFAPYRKDFGWKRTRLDDVEEAQTLRRPLLPFLERLDRELPRRWDNAGKRWVRNDDWLLFQLGDGADTPDGGEGDASGPA